MPLSKTKKNLARSTTAFKYKYQEVPWLFGLNILKLNFLLQYRYKLNTSFLVVFLVGQFAYMIAARFLSIFEIIIDTLFVCNIFTPFPDREHQLPEDSSPPLRTPRTARTTPHNVAFSVRLKNSVYSFKTLVQIDNCP